MSLIVRNKNAILELLINGNKFEKIQIVTDLKLDLQSQKIVETAKNVKVPVEYCAYEQMPKRREGESREVIVGYLAPIPELKLDDLLANLYSKKQDPFLVLINRVEFKNNIGIIARTAFAAGVNGFIYQGDSSDFINEDTIQYSVGSIARIPLVKANIFEALKILKRNGITTLALDMAGPTVYDANLKGGVAFVLGSEDKGVSAEIINKCDSTVSIPMKSGIDSLNVGISAGIVMYEKVRQEMTT